MLQNTPESCEPFHQVAGRLQDQIGLGLPLASKIHCLGPSFFRWLAYVLLLLLVLLVCLFTLLGLAKQSKWLVVV